MSDKIKLSVNSNQKTPNWKEELNAQVIAQLFCIFIAFVASFYGEDSFDTGYFLYLLGGLYAIFGIGILLYHTVMLYGRGFLAEHASTFAFGFYYGALALYIILRIAGAEIPLVICFIASGVCAYTFCKIKDKKNK